MKNTKPYTNKLPRHVATAMTEFSGSECFLIPRLHEEHGISKAKGNCHHNAKGYVEKFGGTVLNGWLLARVNKLLKNGIWIWSFHSIWKDINGKCYDVTEDIFYSKKSHTIFFADKSRTFDHINGISYNNIFILANQQKAKELSSVYDRNINHAIPYWTTDGMELIRSIDEHDGKYKLLNEEFTENIKSFENEYQVKVAGGRILPLNNSRSANDDIYFDYSISMRAA